eukprot:CAMPEP_0169197940 /NCGR_PEP_ID=MMETSP1016-20121227/8549_1 /TAXON_ID=342587 /ORGANISM="Karlodinium micrum, Strain CCMP2283" /LENGTH=51 /DNA_ID=CAMNT_0009274647 /DNA_START=655 /DNA_END=810 /DNA_ORIENTATION=-
MAAKFGKTFSSVKVPNPDNAINSTTESSSEVPIDRHAPNTSRMSSKSVDAT